MAVTFSTVRPRPDLDVESESFTFEGQRLVADDVFPAFMADERAAEFDKIRVGVGAELVGANAQRREAGGRFRELKYETVKDVFATGEHGLEASVDRRVGARNAAAIRRKEVRNARNLWLAVHRAREQEVITATVSNTTDFTTSDGNRRNATATFSDSSDILGEFRTATLAFRDNCGMFPNVCVIHPTDWSVISSNTGVRGAIGDDQDVPGFVSVEKLQALLMIPKIVIPYTPYNTKPRGQAASMGNLWPSGSILFALSLAEDDLEPVQIGRTVYNTDGESCGAGKYGSYGDDPHHSDFTWYGQDRQTKLLNPAAGLVLETTAAG